MEENKSDAPEVPETPETTEETEETQVGESAGQETDETPSDEAEDASDKLKKLESSNKQLYKRLKDAERQLANSQNEGLSQKDILAIAKADVAEEDLDEVLDFMKYKKLDAISALKHPALKAILGARSEERRTAEATQVKGNARGVSKPSGEDVLRKVEKTGEFPSEDEMARIAEARLERRRKQK